MKTPPIKRKTKQTIKAQKPTSSNTHLILLAGLILVLLGIGIMTLIVIHFSNQSNSTIIEPPKDINWFYNKSAELNHLRSRIEDIDNQTKIFINKHGTDETGYDPNEKEKIISLRTARNMIAIDYNKKAAEYNSYAMIMNRSWNKTLPRQMYDIP
jgi:tRNA uridine 5-carbamoylmethylation protein Kti12